jgi:hypothetical protein
MIMHGIGAWGFLAVQTDASPVPSRLMQLQLSLVSDCEWLMHREIAVVVVCLLDSRRPNQVYMSR